MHGSEQRNEEPHMLDPRALAGHVLAGHVLSASVPSSASLCCRVVVALMRGVSSVLGLEECGGPSNPRAGFLELRCRTPQTQCMQSQQSVGSGTVLSVVQNR